MHVIFLDFMCLCESESGIWRYGEGLHVCICMRVSMCHRETMYSGLSFLLQFFVICSTQQHNVHLYISKVL